jgi:hypothetical protein
MSRLFFKLYYAGLSNCRMSLDIGVGMAYLTGRTLVPFAVKPSWSSDPLVQNNGVPRPTVLDLYAIPGNIQYDYANRRKITTKAQTKAPLKPWDAPVADSVFADSDTVDPEDKNFRAFRNGRPHLWRTAEAAHDKDICFDNFTLGMYSHFFYLPEPRRSDLRIVLSKVRPKRIYRELAKKIAASLGPFNAVHIRRGDFRYSRLSPRGDSITGIEVCRNLATRFASRDRLVICTDSSSDKIWFAPLLRHFCDVVFLDQLMLNEWAEDLRALPFYDDSVLALMTQLIAAHAKCFIGTLYSTFSAMIQRERGLKRRQSSFLYCYSDWEPRLVPFSRCEFPAVQDGPYSWNRTLYPVSPGVHAWFREWPEAFAPLATQKHVIPEGIVDLPAAEAHIRGTQLRYERSLVNDNLGYWNNPEDAASWNFKTYNSELNELQLRYACPPECAGSCYVIEIGSQRRRIARVTGCTSSTGSWTVFSSWQPVGRLHLPRGSHTLTVRILSLRGYAAMNLGGVRLIPSAVAVTSQIALQKTERNSVQLGVP